MGNGRYGFSAASEYYFGKPLSSYGPGTPGGRAPRRHHQVAPRLRALGRERGATAAPPQRHPGPDGAQRLHRGRDRAAGPGRAGRRAGRAQQDEDRGAGGRRERLRRAQRPRRDGVSVEALIDGRIRVRATVDQRMQRIVNDALETGLPPTRRAIPRAGGSSRARWWCCATRTRPSWPKRAGGRSTSDRYTSYSDYNRVTDSRRQPGSVMKPIVYLAAFRHGEALDDAWPTSRSR